MAQVKANRKLASLGADLLSTDVSKGYITCIKTKISSAVQNAEENNVLASQGITNNDNEGALTGAVIALSLLSPLLTSQTTRILTIVL